MQRIHVSPILGKRWVETITQDDIERLTRAMLARGAAPKTVRNVMTFLHSVFALAMRSGWTRSNPVVDAARPRRRRDGDVDPDLQFLTLEELDAVIETISEQRLDGARSGWARNASTASPRVGVRSRVGRSRRTDRRAAVIAGNAAAAAPDDSATFRTGCRTVGRGIRPYECGHFAARS